jgi:paraquat-inducible protein B
MHMATPVSKTLIGAFVLGALALVLLAVVMLGSGALFRSAIPTVMFFDGSVGGLQVGAPVTFRGVSVGEVSAIKIVYDPEQREFRIPVSATLYPDRIQSLFPSARETRLNNLIEIGLRAQLQMQSFITGQLSIQLDFMPDSPLPPPSGSLALFRPGVKEIPTIPTPIQRIQKSIEQIPLDEVIRDARETLGSIRDILASPAIPDIIANLQQISQDSVGIAGKVDAKLTALGAQVERTLKELRTLLANADAQIKPLGSAIHETRALAQNLNRQIDPLAAEITRTAGELRSTLRHSENALVHIGRLTADNSEMRYHVSLLMTELTATSRSLRALTDYLERRPDALLRGRTAGQPLGGQQ